VTEVETQKIVPPPALTEPVSQPPLRGERIGDVLRTVPDLRSALRKCNGRLRDVREWSSEE